MPTYGHRCARCKATFTSSYEIARCLHCGRLADPTGRESE